MENMPNTIKNREGFMLYKSFYAPVKGLSNEELGQLFRMIMEFQNHQDSVSDNNVSPNVAMAFEFFKNQFRLDEKKYLAKAEKNRQSALKRWEKESADVCERMQVDAKHADKDKEKEKEKDKDKEKEKGKEKVKDTSADLPSASPAVVLEENKPDLEPTEDTQESEEPFKSGSINSFRKFVKHKDEILERAKKLHPNKDCEKALKNFIAKNEIKNYKYKNFYLAYLNWLGEDKFNEYKLATPIAKIYPTFKATAPPEPRNQEEFKQEALDMHINNAKKGRSFSINWLEKNGYDVQKYINIKK